MSNASIKKLIIGAAFVLGLGFYIYEIVVAGISSLNDAGEPNIPTAISALVTGVGGGLATNFGAFMGITLNTGGGSGAFKIPQFELPSAQALGALVYFGCLLLAGAFWALDGLSENTAELIRNQGATLAGAIVGIVVVTLNTKRP
jgi:hypothetical protein